MDEQTQRLREENRALRELLAAQAQAVPAPQEPGPLRRLVWWLISAPGAALVGWRALVGREHARPITGKRVGYATLTVLYTLAIYGALVLLVVSWSSPNTARSGASAASPVRVPLAPLPAQSPETQLVQPEPTSVAVPVPIPPESESAPRVAAEPAPAEPPPAPSTQRDPALAQQPTANTAAEPVPAPQSTLRVTEIPAENPLAWVDELKGELARCATVGFFERPDCAWAARKQFCEPHHAWGTIKECPHSP